MHSRSSTGRRSESVERRSTSINYASEMARQVSYWMLMAFPREYRLTATGAAIFTTLLMPLSLTPRFSEVQAVQA